MRKSLILFAALFILNASQAFAQQETGRIEVKENFGTTFSQDGKKLTPKQLLDITMVNEDAYEKMKMAKINNDWGTVFGFAGGFLVGWPLGTAIAGGGPNWALAGVGAGLLVVSIPFSSAFKKHAKNAVDIYNAGVGQTGLRKYDYKVELTSTGLGLRMMF